MFWKKKKEKGVTKKDGRVHVNPTVPVELKNEIERLTFILGQSIQRTCILLFIEGISEREVIEHLAPHFRYGSLIFNNSLYIGNPDNPPIDTTIKSPSERISIRLDEDDQFDLKLHASLLDIEEQSKAMLIILDAAIRHPAIIENLLRNQNYRMSFDEVVTSELRKFMRFVNRNNPYRTVWNHTLTQLVDGYSKKPRSLGRPITPECVDTESYRWSFD